MKGARTLVASIVVAVLLFFLPAAGAANGHFGGARFHGHFGGRFHGHFHHHFGVRSHIFIGLGPAFWWGPYWWYPPAYTTPVVVQQTPVYAQPTPTYWYYCASVHGYYPAVAACPEAWIPVPATQ